VVSYKPSDQQSYYERRGGESLCESYTCSVKPKKKQGGDEAWDYPRGCADNLTYPRDHPCLLLILALVLELARKMTSLEPPSRDGRTGTVSFVMRRYCRALYAAGFDPGAPTRQTPPLSCPRRSLHTIIRLDTIAP
jgi:hypothetical protein